MVLKNWLRKAINELSDENGTAQLDAEVMLAFVLNVDRSWLHAHPDEIITENNLAILNNYLQRRAKHEPIAYILEKSEFYGRDFYIRNGVLVPRPESETLIYMCIKLVRDKKIDNTLILDVGCGSGALGITVNLELINVKVIGLDIDSNCLEVSKINAKKHGVNIKFIKSNLLENVVNNMNYKNIIILANLPYVPDMYELNSSAMLEPRHAIFGGPDGLSLYRKLFDQLNILSLSSCHVFTESLPPQHTELAAIADKNNYRLIDEQDFIQLFTMSN